MRLFGYYAWHSFWNQIRKLFKTWVLVFILVCGLVGGLIGFGAASMGDAFDDSDYTEEEMLEEDYWDDGNIYEEEEWADDNLLVELDSFTITDEGDHLALNYTDGRSYEVTIGQFLELIAMLIILAVLIYNILSADKNSSAIFLPADVNLLFAAPMKPQSVLLFRLMCQVGISIFASIYFFGQNPSLMAEFQVPPAAIFGIVAAWLFMMIVGRLLQVFFYTLCSTRTGLKRYLTPGVWGSIVLILGIFLMYTRSSNIPLIPAALRFFNAPVTRWIPLIGWMKGMVLFFYEGAMLPGILCFILLLLGTGLLIWGIWHMKADFYEDAMAKSEELAALMASAEENGSLIATRKKSRSEKIRRNELNWGYGANVFFTKSLYNRFRFARLGIFTKTAITYLGVTLAAFLLGNLMEIQESFQIVALAVGVMVFFRAMGNPLEEDTRMPLFVMIPENTWIKLFWSVLAGTVNCLLDLLPAFVLGAILTGTNPWNVLGYLVLSVDLYATIVGTFIALSIPESIGKLPKQMIQVMFIYFGLIPDVLCIVAGFYLDHPNWGLLGAALINLLLAAIFFLLTPLFLEPKAGARPWVKPVTEEIRRHARKAFGRIGLASMLVLLIATVLQIGIALFAYDRWPELAESGVAAYLMTFLPIYLAAFPLGFLLLRKMDTEKPVRRSLSVPEGIRYVIYSVMSMYLGNILGTLITMLIGASTASEAVNPVESLTSLTDNIPLKILFLVIAAPIVEELFFRKVLIDRMRPYGEKTAMIATALMFGLFHGNFSQFFYAAALGVIFGYVYLQTGKIRYTIGLHMGINFMGGIFAPYIVEKIVDDLANVLEEDVVFGPWMYVYIAYLVILMILTVAGILLLCIRAEKIRFRDVSHELARGQIFRTVWMNPGMILFVLGCAALFVASSV